MESRLTLMADISSDVQTWKYEFIGADKLQSVYDINEIQGRPNKVYQFFLENDDEVLYITREEEIYGLISIGDMFRYYDNDEKEIPIMRKFSYVENASDYAGADAFFKRVETIHEVPVIKDKRLLGVIRRNYNILEDISRDRLKRLLIEASIMQKKRNLISSFCNLSHMKTIIYTPFRIWPKYISEEDRGIFKERERLREYIKSDDFDKLSQMEQENFFKKYSQEKHIEQFLRSRFIAKQLRSYIKNGIRRYEDCHNEMFHIADGYRYTPNVPSNAKRKIWMFGPCITFGCFVKDYETIEYYLQQHLCRNNYDYEVVNCGLRDVTEALFTAEMSINDIIIILDNLYAVVSENQIKQHEILGGCYNGDLSEMDLSIENPLEHFFDKPIHCDRVVNEKIAEKIFMDLLPNLTKDNGEKAPAKALQDYFIPADITMYYEDYIEKYELHNIPDKKIGAIVMNCNPFTYGHRYLIEYACAQVDILYVFVVEEDKSYFQFEDRLEMVRQGTKDLEKVRVLPSGKYIISQDTFAQYFTKDQIIYEIDDTDYDVRIFGEVVAGMLGIILRFVGEEPFDKVTRQYNETMKRILPEYGIELIEIPRKKMDGDVISASKVREYLKQDKIEKAYELLPESTRRYLNGKIERNKNESKGGGRRSPDI